MKRRELMKLLGGAALAWPLAAAARGSGQPRRLGVVMAAGKTPEYAAAFAAFLRELETLGWKPGENLLVDERWSAAGRERARAAAAEIGALRPDVVLAQSVAVVGALRAAAPSTPIVFVHVPDPVASGFVASLARPGGRITGITNIEPSIGGKWLELLKEVAPGVTRAAMLVNADSPPALGAIFLRPFEAAARSLGVTAVNGEVRGAAGLEPAVAGLAARPGGGLVVMPDGFFANHSAQIVALAGRFRLPAVYPYRYYVAQGGLLCYGVNNVDLFRQAAPYVDRVLRGARPADLPVQQPTRFELVVNANTAKALGLTIPQSILARADEVIS
jgi:putative ABC transport system substrate-binding protein